MALSEIWVLIAKYLEKKDNRRAVVKENLWNICSDECDEANSEKACE